MLEARLNEKFFHIEKRKNQNKLTETEIPEQGKKKYDKK